MAITAAELIVRVGADTSAAERDLSRFNSRSMGLVGGLKSAFGGLGSAFGSMFNVAGGMLMYNQFQNLTRGVRDLTGEALQAYATFERLGMSLTAMGQRELVSSGQFDSMADALGAASSRSKELITWIEQMAVLSPFTQDDIFKTFRLAQAYGFTSEQAKRLTKATTDFAAGTGASGYVIDRIGLALGQIQARGHLAGTEVRQLTEAGVGVMKVLSNAFGVTTEELQKMIEGGLVPADAAVEAIIRSFEKDFPDAAKNQAETFSGLISSLHDIKQIGLRDFFAGTFKAIQPYLQNFVNWFTNPLIRQRIREIGADLGVWVEEKLKGIGEAAERFGEAFTKGGGGVQGFIRGTLAAIGLPAPEDMQGAIRAQIDSWAASVKNFLFAGGWQAAAQDIAVKLDLEGLKDRISTQLAGIDWTLATPIGMADHLAEQISVELDKVDWAQASQDFAGFIDSVATSIDAVDWTSLGNQAGGFFRQILDLYAGLGDLFSGSDGAAKSGFGKLRASIDNALQTIDWTTLDTSFTGLKREIGKALAELSAGFQAGSGIDFKAKAEEVRTSLTDAWNSFDATMQYLGGQGLIDDIASQIEQQDWTKISLDFAGLLDQMGLQISAINWHQLGKDFGEKIRGALSDMGSETSKLDFTKLGDAVKKAWDNFKWDAVNFKGDSLMAAIDGAISSFVLGTLEGIKIEFPGWETLIEWPTIEGPDWGKLITWPTIEAPDWSSLIAWPALADVLQMIQDAVREKFSGLSWGNALGYNPGANSGNFARKPIQGTDPFELGFLPPIPGGASGFRKFRGGLAVVGEEGPELVNLPGGADVFSNPQSLAILRAMGIPGFAQGTMPGGGVPTSGAASIWGSDVIYGGDLSQALGGAATNLEGASKSMKAATAEFERMLQSVPGLFSTSPVTDQQMKMAELGVPQNFADDYLRRLTDEVVNGVDWEGVDIKDAAARAGIDPNLPAEAILEMFRSAWADSSLFSDPNNLDLINQSAVQAAMQRQTESQMGKANIAELFGITPDDQAVEMQNIINGMVAGLTPETTAPLGEALYAQIQDGVNAAAASGSGEGISTGIQTSISAPQVVSSFYSTGQSVATYILEGINDGLAGLDWSGITPPAGGTPPTPPVGNNALGTNNWRGGWSWVGERGPELLNLPKGSRVMPTSESLALAGNRQIVINAVVPDNLAAERMAQRITRIERRRSR